MTSRPSTGTLLAIGGGVAIVAAIIAGLAVTGGPGDARASRLNEARLVQMRQIAIAAQCAFWADGQVPAMIEEMTAAVSRHKWSSDDWICYSDPVQIGPDLDVSYTARPPSAIELCADFADTRATAYDARTYFPQEAAPNFPELPQKPEAGRHCYTVQLSTDRSGSPADGDAPIK